MNIDAIRERLTPKKVYTVTEADALPDHALVIDNAGAIYSHWIVSTGQSVWIPFYGTDSVDPARFEYPLTAINTEMTTS